MSLIFFLNLSGSVPEMTLIFYVIIILLALTEPTVLTELTALTGAYRTQPMVVSVATYFPFFWTSVRRLRPIFS